MATSSADLIKFGVGARGNFSLSQFEVATRALTPFEVGAVIRLHVHVCRHEVNREYTNAELQRVTGLSPGTWTKRRGLILGALKELGV